MRMDRYEEEEKTNDTKQTRTNKNQELYTDVYLNNVYVDINNLKEVMERENFEEDNKQETLKVVKETLPTSHPYQEKKYDIVSIIDEAIKNKKDDNLIITRKIRNNNNITSTIISQRFNLRLFLIAATVIKKPLCHYTQRLCLMLLLTNRLS